jgi:hypothetical protein
MALQSMVELLEEEKEVKKEKIEEAKKEVGASSSSSRQAPVSQFWWQKISLRGSSVKEHPVVISLRMDSPKVYWLSDVELVDMIVDNPTHHNVREWDGPFPLEKIQKP